MSETILDAEGNEVEVFIRTTSGFVDAICRADDQATWEAAALSQGLLVETDDALRPARGAAIDALGPVVLTPGTYDEDGNELTPPVMDTRYHVNLRITEPLLSSVNSEGFPKWKVTAINWTRYGQADNANAGEVATKLAGVALIDPETINSPSRVWL